MKTTPDIDEEIERFFQHPPTTGRGNGPTYSILFLLRRDLRDLTGPEDEPAQRARLRSPILASFGIMTGLELLARVWLGLNDPGQARVKKAFKEILGIDDQTAAYMIHFRNAIGHGYQLSIIARTGERHAYHFALDDNIHIKSSLIDTKSESNETYVIRFWELRSKFFSAIQKVHTAVKNPENTQLRMNFYSMLPYLRPYVISSSPSD